MVAHIVCASATYNMTFSSSVSRYTALLQNGWRLEFVLPVAGEYATLATPERAWLDTILSRPELLSGDLP